MKTKIGLIQMFCDANKEANILKSITEIKAAHKKGAQIVCLQELFTSLYFCHVEDQKNFNLAEPIPGKTSERFQELAKGLGIVLVLSLFEKRTAGIYHNTAIIIDADGTLLGKYRKMHIPDDPGYHEKYYFTPGDLGYQTWETRFGKIAVLICWDQWFPEAARISALKGADILFFPTAIGWDITEKSRELNKEQFDAWQTIQKSHAIANGVYVVAVNRTGVEEGQNFWGGSFVSNPHGRIIFSAPHEEEITHVEEIDLSNVEKYRTTWPYLRDRRIDSYKPILKRFIDPDE